MGFSILSMVLTTLSSSSKDRDGITVFIEVFEFSVSLAGAKDSCTLFLAPARAVSAIAADA